MVAPVQDADSSSPNANQTRTESDALRLIARAEQSVSGLVRKLKKRRHDETCIEAVVSALLEKNLVNDLRFAKLWLGSRMHLPRSPRRLLAGLCSRGIERQDGETALKTVLDEETEFLLLTRFLKKYAKKAASNDRLSLKFLLKNEGFSPQVIQRYFDEICRS